MREAWTPPCMQAESAIRTKPSRPPANPSPTGMLAIGRGPPLQINPMTMHAAPKATTRQSVSAPITTPNAAARANIDHAIRRAAAG
jgi:hypothetical protein